jgi:hypothetical protein
MIGRRLNPRYLLLVFVLVVLRRLLNQEPQITFKCAIVTLIYNADYLEPLYALDKSLDQHRHGCDRILFTTPTNNISIPNAHIMSVPLLDEYPRLCKLHAWNLTDYSSVLLLDIDMVVVDDISALFSLHSRPDSPAIAGVSDVGFSALLNTGMILLRPNATLFNLLVARLATPRYQPSSDQRYLNTHICQANSLLQSTSHCLAYWTLLPHSYNFFAQLQSHMWFGRAYLTDNPRILHFAGMTKPWDFYKKSSRKWKTQLNPWAFLHWKLQLDRSMHWDCHDAVLDRGIPLRLIWGRAADTFDVIIPTQMNNTVRPISTLQQVVASASQLSKVRQIILLHYHDIPSGTQFNTTTPIKLIRVASSSFNARFMPLNNITDSDAILQLDDDMILTDYPLMDSLFEAWRDNQHRLVGLVPRKITHEEYHWTPPHTPYSIVLTKAMFIHRNYHLVYSCLIPSKVLNMVDELNNCEDLSMNFLASGMTGVGPLVASNPNQPFEDIGRPGRSSAAGYRQERQECLRRLAGVFGPTLKPTSYTLAIGSSPSWFNVLRPQPNQSIVHPKHI